MTRRRGPFSLRPAPATAPPQPPRDPPSRHPEVVPAAPAAAMLRQRVELHRTASVCFARKGPIHCRQRSSQRDDGAQGCGCDVGLHGGIKSPLPAAQGHRRALRRRVHVARNPPRCTHCSQAYAATALHSRGGQRAETSEAEGKLQMYMCELSVSAVSLGCCNAWLRARTESCSSSH
jgi:hypothetical protein